MKKSELYKIAQHAVINCEHILTETKVAILKELIKEEELALFRESQKEKEENNG